MRSNVLIETYDTDRIDNPSPSGAVDGATWMKIRNALVVACRKHGPTGPLGTFNFEEMGRTGDYLKSWQIGDDDCLYYIIPDQYNDIDRYHYIEVISPESLTKEWLSDMMDTLLTSRSWGLGVSNINGGYMLIFADRIMITGSVADPVVPHDFDTLVEAVRPHLAT